MEQQEQLAGEQLESQGSTLTGADSGGIQAAAGQQAVSPPGDMAASASGGAAGSPVAAPGFLDTLRQHGLPLQGDEAAAAKQLIGLYQQAAQMQQWMPHLQTYLQNQGQFQEYLTSRQQVKPEEPKPWHSEWHKPPEYDPSWERLVTTDEQGNLVPVRGAPLDIIPKLQHYAQYRRNVADKFMNNPYEFMEQPIRHLAKEVATQAIREHLQKYDDHQFASRYIGDNSNWIYQRDQLGNVVSDPRTGQAMLSNLGSRLGNVIGAFDQAGVKDLGTQQQWAQYIVSLEHQLAQQQYSQQQATSQQPVLTPLQQANQQFVQTQALRPANGNVAVPASRPKTQRELAQAMKARFQAEGIE